MSQFQDSHGEQWPIRITIGTAIRVKNLLGIDLLQPLEAPPKKGEELAEGASALADDEQLPLLTRIHLDPILLCNLLYVVVKPDAEQRQISDEAFAERLSGEALHAAYEALMESWSDFFQGLNRPEIVRAISKYREVTRRAYELGGQLIDSDEFNEQIEQELQKIPGSLSGSSPAESESIPSRERSAS